MPAPISDTGILDVLDLVPDPRARRGVRHRLAVILSVALAGVCAGARSFTAVAEWVHDVPADVLDRLGIKGRPPSESTIRRTLGRLDAAVLDQVIGVWAWLRTGVVDGRRVVAVDGKTLRGAKDAAGHLTHLLAALDQGSGVVLGQVEVGAKTNEIPLITDLLDALDLTDVVVTADALHCQRGTADYIVGRGGHYVFTVKNNQRSLRNLLKSLPWNDIPVCSSTGGRGHGRLERRTIKATEVDAGLGFPHACQVLQVRRTVTRNGRKTVEVVYLITSMPMTSAAPSQVAAWIRGHWAIENRLHWVRDVTFDEDRSTISTGTAPRVMATIRNTAVSILRLAGHTSIATALRHHSRNPHRPIDLLHTI
ncbi:ISAs1 family transposase [Rhodococcus ruber]|nr:MULTISPECIES: ISAs1 family transposase [Rhodococcus]PND53180.1 ISAs1 family transposase [Rhodococcus sp. ENV425]MBC2592613.1 ISAs1 family transposase [Rhodococcus aetherivorans]MCD2129691.1 ISAs1 family transposase [Rhodococcus ruber]MCZ4506575.1 ISAs1 family transposase [Rhodococcus ruber]MCZ4533668.1 ISAs1 family transposase [Rhodococcus ruber]